ncbi:MAG: DNA/RNA helicase [Rivularia sp. T60_A2020_040]|nr:DNA/RNA helicase [Rivularia sp. T60_A2020_040]
MNTAIKIDAILNAWFNYIELDDYSSARIEAGNQDKVVQRGVSLNGDRVIIDQKIFSDLHSKVNTKNPYKQDITWVLSFPQVIDPEKKKYFCPLFSLDITSIFKDEYQEQGWNIEELKLIEAGENLAKFLGLDDEQQEKLITQNGLRSFLETTFEIEFQTYEQWMQRFSISSYRYKIQRQPYLFEWNGGGFSYNLKQDFKDIKSSSKKWTTGGHPAYEYLFGEPQPAKHEVLYMGAFPTHPPTSSQLTAIKHSQSEPITAVQGPPGSGKTTLILHVIAQQVVKRALHLIEIGEDINNFTVISSTNNKAVENVIEKIDKVLPNQIFYLKGGSQNNINSTGGALEKLDEAICFLQKNEFNANIFNGIKQQIKQIKTDLVAQESDYKKQRQQRTLDEKRLLQLREEIQKIKQQLEAALSIINQYQRRSTELAEYEQVPIEAYRKIRLRFDNAERQLPEGRLPWWIRFWQWIRRKTEKIIIEKAALACESAIENTLNTPFPVRNPITRSDLIQQAQLVRERLENAEELNIIQERLENISENVRVLGQNNDEFSNELTLLENRLAIQLKDFYATFHQNFHEKYQELFQLSRDLLIQQALFNKDNVKTSLEKYLNLLSEKGRAKDKIADKMQENLDEHIKNVSLMFPVITSTLLSIRNMLPWIEQCVDRIIVDEAGMIPQHQTFPLLVRSHRAIIVGDPLQIEPIITLSDQRRDNYCQTAFIDRGLTKNDYHRYSPEEVFNATTYHRAAGASGEDEDKGKGIQLTEHYRCQPNIIDYCDKIAGYNLEVKTELTSSKLESNLIAYHVEGNIIDNVNLEEVTAVCELVQHLLNQDYAIEDIGVISAFRPQANALEKSLLEKFPKFDKQSVGTVHTFQGAEKKVIIFSTRVSPPQDNSKVGWINKRPNLLNVAVSRAKELFILVGNLDRLKKRKLTRQLVEHIQEQGIILEYKTQAEIPQLVPGVTAIYDCNHLNIFRDAIEQAEQELIIVTPWIRGIEPTKFVNDIVSALERGVKVTVIYGNKSSEDNDNNDVQAENRLKELFSQYSSSKLICLGREIHLESRGTNERILVCDSKFAIVGSWNWLSHHYRDSCRKLLIKPNVQIRRETSLQLSDSASIADIKARVNKLIT